MQRRGGGTHTLGKTGGQMAAEPLADVERVVARGGRQTATRGTRRTTERTVVVDLREQVALILRSPDAAVPGDGEWSTGGKPRAWEVQGFGMLRTYLPGDRRLQIWDPRLAAWGNNAVHDHPWDFTSTIVAGTIFNERFRLTTKEQGREHLSRKIKPGVGGGRLDTEPSHHWLKSQGLEVYGPGETYSQRAAELHVTRYAPSTITLLTRTGRLERDEAWSHWPAEQEAESVFVEPRPATPYEITLVCHHARRQHFSFA